jgi:hypothetical protein
VFGKDPSDGKLFAICSLGLHNTSTFDIYYEIEDANLVLDGRATTSTATSAPISEPLIIQAGAISYFRFASIPNVTIGSMGGMMKLKAKYGKKSNQLNRSVRIVAEPVIGLALDPQTDKPIGTVSTLSYREVVYA